MEDLVEIRWHGRGGQGAKTASNLLATSAMSVGLFFQSFSEYGPERMGAPVQSFTRLSKEPINIHSHIQNPDVVVVLDHTLIDAIDVTSGLPDDGILLVNTPLHPSDIRKKLNTTKFKIFTVDATHIAIETIGRPIPNTPMLGALAAINPIIKLEDLEMDMRKKLGHKFSQKIVEGNVNALNRAYKEVKKENE